MKKNKNVSRKVKNGQIVHTRDEYFYGKKDYRKPDYENKGNYRMAVVVDSNRDDELAVVKLTTADKGKQIGTTKSKYKPFIETKDCNSKPIKQSKMFVADKKNKLSVKQSNEIKKECVNDKKTKLRNRKLLRFFKKR